MFEDPSLGCQAQTHFEAEVEIEAWVEAWVEARVEAWAGDRGCLFRAAAGCRSGRGGSRIVADRKTPRRAVVQRPLLARIRSWMPPPRRTRLDSRSWPTRSRARQRKDPDPRRRENER